MITLIELENICSEYDIDAKTLVKNNENVLEYGEKENIHEVLRFLRKELKINSKNIEKCPSVIFFGNIKDIKLNWEFLIEKEINKSDLEKCLHILTVTNRELKETYEYVKENYGIGYINEILSILRVPISRIKEIENTFTNLKQKNILQAAYSKWDIEELQKIVEVCKKNNIEITGSVFSKSAEKLEENIQYIKENFGENLLTPLIISKNKKQLQTILPFLKEIGYLEILPQSPSILTLTLDEIKARIEFIQSTGENMLNAKGDRFNSIFGLSRKNFQKNKQEKAMAKDVEKLGKEVSGLYKNPEYLASILETVNKHIEKGKDEKKGEHI